jgi:hypothetical protein
VDDRNLTVLVLKRRIAAEVSLWTGIIFSIRLGKIPASKDTIFSRERQFPPDGRT